MAPSVTSSQAFAFADGNAGHVCIYTAGAPAVGDWDILCVNSDTTVSTPTGFTASVSAVTSQGAYIFTRKAVGGETDSVTITTTGNFNAHVAWVRVIGADVIDVTGSAQIDGVSGTTTPAFTSSALTQSGELALAFGAVHNWSGGIPTAPSWSVGYTSVIAGSQGNTTTGVYGTVAAKVPAGTAAESPSVSWTNAALDRYILFLTLTAVAAGQSISPTGVSIATTVGSPSLIQSADIAPIGINTPVALGSPSLVQSSSISPTGIIVPVSVGAVNVSSPTSGVDVMTLAFTIVTGVGEYVQSQLVATEGGAPARVCLGVPGTIAWDNCECGQLAQSIVDIHMTNNFPTPATDVRITACGPGIVAVNVTLSLTRCVPTIQDNGSPPTCAALLTAARVLEDDREAVLMAVLCHLRSLRQQYRISDFTIGAVTTVGPDGACAGVQVPYQFGINLSCC